MTDHDPEQAASLLVGTSEIALRSSQQPNLQHRIRVLYILLAFSVVILLLTVSAFQNRLIQCKVDNDIGSTDSVNRLTQTSNDDQQQQAATESELADAKFDRLMEWLIRNGATVDGVVAKKMFAGGGRGVYALKDLKQGDLVMSIPSQLWIGDRNAHVASAVGYVIGKDEVARQYAETEGDAWALIMMLEYEKYNPYSFYKPYADFIPKPASPIWWSVDDVDQFQSPSVSEKIASYRKNIEDAYEGLMKHLIEAYPVMFSAENNTLDSFAASTITAWTRTFDVSHSGDKVKESALIPMGDLLNHKSGTPMTHWRLKYPTKTEHDDQKAKAETTDHNPARRTPAALSFDFHMPEDKPSGEQVVISYSDRRTAFSWIIWAGFAPEDEFGDYLTVTVDINALLRSRPGLHMDKQVLKKQLTAWVAVDGAVSSSFLSACHKIIFGDSNRSTPDKWVKTMEWLRDEIILQESSLLTSLEHDEDSFAALKQKTGRYSDEKYFHRHLQLGFRTRFKRIIRRMRENLEYAAEQAKLEDATVGSPQWKHEVNPKTILSDLARDRKGWGFDGIVSYGFTTLTIQPK
eukprot:c2146_g1_i1.p1 GENE.c2146_g1_i1~~c2146_g1_i1.p1  ORF type:complete len:576 (-),score=138.14 c2146_g1_i1:301-2028(-)